MSKKILIPLDGSEIGEAALRYVEENVSSIEVGGGAEVILLHVITTPLQSFAVLGSVSVPNPLPFEEIEGMKQNALDYLNNAGEGLRKIGVDVRCEVIVGETSDRSAEEIIKVEEELDIDLVAMSTHGRRGISRWAFGSVTEKVLRGGNVPVLVVRAKK